MALVLRAGPEVNGATGTPVKNTDWKLSVDIKTAQSLQVTSRPFFLDFDNNIIPQGIVLQIGGAIYEGISDTLITGIKSNYVKIIPDDPEASAEYVSDLTGVAWNKVYNGYYDSSVTPNLYIFDEHEAFLRGELTAVNGEIASNIKAAVYDRRIPFYASSSTVLSTTVSGASLDVEGLDADTFIIANNTLGGGQELVAWERDPSTKAWSVSASLEIGTVIGPAIAKLTSSNFAWIDTSAENLTMYTYNGASITPVGNALNIPGVDGCALSRLNDTTIALASFGLDELRTYSFDGSDWAQVGNSFSLPAGGSITKGMETIETNTISLCSFNLDSLRAYFWDGTDWGQVGNTLTRTDYGSASAWLYINNQLLNINGGSNFIRTFLWDGSDFVEIGRWDNLIGTFRAGALLSDNEFIVYQDTGIFRPMKSYFVLELLN